MNYDKENIDITQAEIQQKQMERDLMYQNMISEGKKKKEDWNLKMGIYDFPQSFDKDIKQDENDSKTR